MGANRNASRIVMGEKEGKRPLRRPKCRWVTDIETDLRKTGWGGMDWIDLTQDRDRWRALVSMEHSGSIKCYEILELLSDWRLLKTDSTLWN
jgi:hypothetical protein